MNKTLYFAAAAAMVLVSCAKEIEPYEAAPAETGNQFYFSNKTASAVEVTPDYKSQEVILSRYGFESAGTAVLEVTDTTKDHLFFSQEKSTVNLAFAANEKTAKYSFPVNYDKLVLGRKYAVSFKIQSEASQYGISELKFVFLAPEPWEHVGPKGAKAKMSEGYAWGVKLEAELERNALHPEQFRLHYKEGLAEAFVASGDIDKADELDAAIAPGTIDEFIYFTLVKPGDKMGFVESVKSKDLVYFQTFYTGSYYSAVSSNISCIHPSDCDAWKGRADIALNDPSDESFSIYNKVTMYQEDGETPAVIQLAPVYYLPDYGAGWAGTWESPFIEIVFPGVEITTDYNEDFAYVPLYEGSVESEGLEGIGINEWDGQLLFKNLDKPVDEDETIFVHYLADYFDEGMGLAFGAPDELEDDTRLTGFNEYQPTNMMVFGDSLFVKSKGGVVHIDEDGEMSITVQVQYMTMKLDKDKKPAKEVFNFGIFEETFTAGSKLYFSALDLVGADVEDFTGSFSGQYLDVFNGVIAPIDIELTYAGEEDGVEYVAVNGLGAFWGDYAAYCADDTVYAEYDPDDECLYLTAQLYASKLLGAYTMVLFPYDPVADDIDDEAYVALGFTEDGTLAFVSPYPDAEYNGFLGYCLELEGPLGGGAFISAQPAEEEAPKAQLNKAGKAQKQFSHEPVDLKASTPLAMGN